ncbi:MAG: GrpB family protein [Pseudomonadota bacterium]
MTKIVIHDYQPFWAQEFAEIATSLRALLGDLVLRIDHIGSTAVPGLAAKDVIDLQITVVALANDEVSGSLAQAGYRETPNVWDNLVGVPDRSEQLAKRFFVQPEGQRRAHVHVREAGRLNQQYPLLFRDYLRHEPAARHAYQAIKQALAERFADDVEAYYAIKDPYMDTVYQAASWWAQVTRWQPDEDFR